MSEAMADGLCHSKLYLRPQGILILTALPWIILERHPATTHYNSSFKEHSVEVCRFWLRIPGRTPSTLDRRTSISRRFEATPSTICATPSTLLRRMTFRWLIRAG